jgi:hypothetical protein
MGQEQKQQLRHTQNDKRQNQNAKLKKAQGPHFVI